MKNLYTPEVVFKTQEEAVKWLDDEEYKKEYKNGDALMNYAMEMESGYNEYEALLMYDYFVRTGEQLDVPVLNYLYGNTFVMYDYQEECFVVNSNRRYGIFKFSVPSYLIANANHKQTVTKYFDTMIKIYEFLKNDFKLRENVKEFEELLNNSNEESPAVLTAEIYNKIKKYFNSKWVEDEKDTVAGYKLFEMIIDNLMTDYNISLDEALFQECKRLFAKHAQNLEFFDEF